MPASEAARTRPFVLACGAGALLANRLLDSVAWGHGEWRCLLDAAPVTVAFATLVWPPRTAMLLALILGLDRGLAAAAPAGLMPAAAALATLGLLTLRRRWLHSGANDLPLAAGLWVGLARASELCLLVLRGRPLGVVSLFEALIVPTMLLQATLGLALRAPLVSMWRSVARTPQTFGPGHG